MALYVMRTLVLLFTALTSVHAYWLMGIEDFITTERLDPIISPGTVSGHAHSVLGGSNFRMNTNTAALRQSECTSIPIPEDKSSYWFPHLYFQHSNGSFTSLNGGAVIDTPGTTTAFPDDFRMISGDPTLRTYDPTSHAQQAVTFLCLDFNGVSTRFNSLPAQSCPSGVRAQINFPSCWDGKNLDSPDHKSHVAFLSGGPDSGTCSDPNFPVVLPRIFIEVYWDTASFDSLRSSAMNSSQPFVYAYGDPTGYGYHADFLNGWDKGVLQNAVDKCHCNPYGDPQCCVDQGIFSMNQGKTCRITKSVDEQTTGTLSKLPGNNPIQKEGVRATMFTDTSIPTLLSPVYAYTGDTPTQVGKPVVAPASGGPVSSSSAAVSPSVSTKSVSSSAVAAPSSPVAMSSSPAPGGSSTSAATVSRSTSAGGASASSTIVSSNPVVSATAPSASVPSVSAHSVSAPPASGGSHSSSLLASASTRSVGPTSTDTASPTSSSGTDDEDDCGDEEDDGEDDTNGGTPSVSMSPIPASSPSGSPVHGATPSPSVPVSSTSGSPTSGSPVHGSTPSPSVPVSSTSGSPVHSSSSQTHASTSAQASPTSSDENDDDLDYCDEDDSEAVPLAPSATPAPPSSGSGSNHPKPNSVHSVSLSTVAVVPTPVTTVAAAVVPTPVTTVGAASPTGNFLPVASSQPVCSAGKFRHKKLREAKAQQQKRALHHAHSIHDRFMRTHRRAL